MLSRSRLTRRNKAASLSRNRSICAKRCCCNTLGILVAGNVVSGEESWRDWVLDQTLDAGSRVGYVVMRESISGSVEGHFSSIQWKNSTSR